MASATDSAAATSSPPEIGRVRNSQGLLSVMMARIRLISIWSPRISPRISGASGKPAFTST